MTWTTPPTVVTGQLYTAAMFNTYTRDNTNHLRTLLGSGSDPASAPLALISNGLTSALWQLIPDAAMLNQKTNIFPPVYTTFAAVAPGYSGFFNINNAAGVADGPVVGGADYYCIQVRYPNTGIDYRLQLAFLISDNAQSYQRLIIGGSPTAWAKVWNSANDGAGSGLDADLLDGFSTGAGNNQIPINNSAYNALLNAGLLAGYQPGNAAGAFLGINNSILNTGLNADQVDSHHSADITPDNARVWFNSVAELTAAGAHWTRDTAANGRLLIGGDELAVVSINAFSPGTNYGSNWTPAIGVSANNGTLAGTIGSLGVSIPSAAVLSILMTASPPQVNVAQSSHGHTGSVTGAPGLSGSVAIAGTSTQWLPFMRAVVWAKKV